MSVENWLNYEQYIEYQNKQLAIWGQPVTIFHPERKIALGYEDTNYSEIEKMDSDKVLGNLYHKSESRIWINFTVSKNVFYKFNWFPEDSDELCMAIMKSDSPVQEDDYIRTSIPGATSIWGDMVFVVVKIIDSGIANVLQRQYFLKPTNNADLKKELSF